jgi:thioredoxin
MKPIELTKQTFLENVCNYEKNPNHWTFDGDKPCLIDFFATWCGPCKMVTPVIDDLAEEYGDKVNFYKVDIDREGELASAFGIKSVPTFVFCPQEGNPQAISGAMGKADLKKTIEDILLKNRHSYSL